MSEVGNRWESVVTVPAGDDQGPVLPEAEKTFSVFQEAMDDDFNTAAAIGHLYEAFVLANKLLDDPKAAEAADFF